MRALAISGLEEALRPLGRGALISKRDDFTREDPGLRTTRGGRGAGSGGAERDDRAVFGDWVPEIVDLALLPNSINPAPQPECPRFPFLLLPPSLCRLPLLTAAPSALNAHDERVAVRPVLNPPAPPAAVGSPAYRPCLLEALGAVYPLTDAARRERPTKLAVDGPTNTLLVGQRNYDMSASPSASAAQRSPPSTAVAAGPRSPRSPPHLSPKPKHQAQASRPSSSHSQSASTKTDANGKQPESSTSTLSEKNKDSATTAAAAAMDVDDTDANPKTTTTATMTTAKAPAPLSASPTPAPAGSPSAHPPSTHQHNQHQGDAAAQLALLLSTALADAESLRAALQSAEHRARRAERLLTALQMPSGSGSGSASSPTTDAAASVPAGDGDIDAQSSNRTKEKVGDVDADEDMDVEKAPDRGSENDSTKTKTKTEDKERTTTMPEAAVKAILDAEARAERAERTSQELQTHLHLLLSHYTTFERFLATLELRQADARGAFGRVLHALAASGDSPIPGEGLGDLTTATAGLLSSPGVQLGLPRVPSPYTYNAGAFSFGHGHGHSYGLSQTYAHPQTSSPPGHLPTTATASARLGGAHRLGLLHPQHSHVQLQHAQQHHPLGSTGSRLPPPPPQPSYSLSAVDPASHSHLHSHTVSASGSGMLGSGAGAAAGNGAGVGPFHTLPLPPPPSATTAGSVAHLYHASNNGTASSSLTHPHSNNGLATNGSVTLKRTAQRRSTRVNANGSGSLALGNPSLNSSSTLGLGNGSASATLHADEWAGEEHGDGGIVVGVKRRRVWDGDESPLPSPLAHSHSSAHHGQQQLQPHSSHAGPTPHPHSSQVHNQQPSPPYTHRAPSTSAGARRFDYDSPAHAQQGGEYYYRGSPHAGGNVKGAPYDPVRGGYAPASEEYTRGASRHLRHSHSNSHRSAGRERGRGRSASRSSADSWSIDEMLLETATDGGNVGGSAVNGNGSGSAGSGRERGYNDRDRERGYERYEREGRYEERSRGGGVYDSRELRGGRRAGEGASDSRTDSGLAPSVQTYQTHIFAPPVTGAPTKKAKGAGSLASAASPSASFVGGASGGQQSPAQAANGASAQGQAAGATGDGGRGGVPAAQLVTLGPGGVVVSGGGAATAPPPSALPGGGYPAQNAAGQRICRQCGMAGRYKEGKCVEKWGPGPEGPGTVCDRCRKKMKRVERRGTIDQAASHAVLAQTHNALLQHQQNHQAAQQSQQQQTPAQAQAVPATVINPAGTGTGVPQMHARASHTQTQPYGQAAQQQQQVVGQGMTRGDTMIIDRERERERREERTQLLSPRPTLAAAAREREYGARGGRATSTRAHSPMAERSTYQERGTVRSHHTPANAAHLLHSQATASQTQGSGRRPPTPPYINSISTREQQAYGSGSGVGDNGEDELVDGDAEGEGELDVDAEIVRTLPSSSSRERETVRGGREMARSPGTSTTASVGSGGSPRVNGAKAASMATAAAASHPSVNGRYASSVNGYSASKHTLAHAHSGNGHHNLNHNAHLRYSNTRGGERDRDSMDIDRELEMELDGDADADADGDVDADADADADAELLDAVDAATATASAGGGRMKEEDM